MNTLEQQKTVESCRSYRQTTSRSPWIRRSVLCGADLWCNKQPEPRNSEQRLFLVYMVRICFYPHAKLFKYLKLLDIFVIPKDINKVTTISGFSLSVKLCAAWTMDAGLVNFSVSTLVCLVWKGNCWSDAAWHFQPDASFQFHFCRLCQKHDVDD